MELLDNFRYLPKEIINTIINYTDKIVYRHGKYIDRLQKNDDRYNLIKQIPRPIYIGPHKIILRLMNNINHFGYLMEYYICVYLTRVNIRFCKKEMNGISTYIETKSNDTYILDINNRWFRIFNYSM